jgi:guanylate kinase
MAPSVPRTKQSTRLLLWLVQLGGSVVIAPPKFSQADQRIRHRAQDHQEADAS